MTRLELLAKHLDVEASEYEKQATQNIFTEGLDFWMLCIEARRILNEEKEKLNDKNIG